MNIQAEYTRRWLGYHDTYDTYNYCVFSEELTRCDLVIDISGKNCARCSPAKTQNANNEER